MILKLGLNIINLGSVNTCFIPFFSSPKTPIELAIDFILHDFEMAGQFETTPSPVRFCLP